MFFVFFSGCTLPTLWDSPYQGPQFPTFLLSKVCSEGKYDFFFYKYALLGQAPHFADKETEVPGRPRIWVIPVSLKVAKSTAEFCGHLLVDGMRLRVKQTAVSGL